MSDDSEICDGIDNNDNGVVDEAQTGWPGFCDRSALVSPLGYRFRYPLAFWRDAFNRRWNDPTFLDSRAAARARADSCDPCEEHPYNLHRIFKALLAMYDGTGEDSYLEDAVDLADRMIAASDVYNPAWARPVDARAFSAWTASVGTLRYWSVGRCAPKLADGAPRPGYRYMLDELQGVRGIAEVARVLAQGKDKRARKYIDYAAQVVGFYAMEGGGAPLLRLDAAGDKREHYAMAAIDLYRATGETRFLDWAKQVAARLLREHLTLRSKRLVFTEEGAPYDTSHANRGAEFVRYWKELAQPDADELVLGAVNTLLFQIWESSPAILMGDGVEKRPPRTDYPHLFRNWTDGGNACWAEANPPYRTGQVLMGWHELGRFDRRVLYLMETLAHDLVTAEVIQRFPGGGACAPNGNTNYSFVLVAIGEMARATWTLGAAHLKTP